MSTMTAIRGKGMTWQILFTAGIFILTGIFFLSCRDKGVNNNIDDPVPTGDWQLHLIHSGIAQHGENEIIRIRVFDPNGFWPDVSVPQFNELRVASISTEGQSITSSVFIAQDTLATPNGSITPLTYISQDTTLPTDLIQSYLINILDTLAFDSLVIVLNPDF